MMGLPVRFSRLACLSILLFAVAVQAADHYWQQEVNYVMQVTLQSDLRTITGQTQIEYINNSPDTLRELYIKAFPNSVQRGSYADLKARTQNNYSFAELKPEREARMELDAVANPPAGYYRVQTLTVDNTIITAKLERPINPGDTARLAFRFTTLLPDPPSMRMGRYRELSTATYWYPQVCVYDRKMGWVNAQYLGWGECYGDFGKFDVTITVREDQIVAATGLLVNENELLPDTLRQKLNRTNFTGPRDSWPSLTFDKNRTKSWHYVAERTNDFTFVSSSQFCLDSTMAGNTPIVAYILRSHATAWESAIRLGREAVETMSERFYPYQWPILRMVDCYSGMELPMLVQLGGRGLSPGFYIVIYHEIAHQWFMGQVGSNQVDRPFLDEGFTTFAEHGIMEKYLGRDGNMNQPDNWYERTFAPLDEDRNVRGFRPLLLLQKDEYDKPTAFSYDQGEEYFPYRVSAYYKSAAMLYSLQGMLGDSAFYAAMHDYCRAWFFRHPYEEDVTASLEKSTGLELDAYLQQWYYGRARLDYAVEKCNSERRSSGWKTEIALRNRGRLMAPLDIAVLFENGDTSFYTVTPEGMACAKPGYTLLPVWNQFRRFDERYRFAVNSTAKVKRVVIDPDEVTMDINRLNNSSGALPPLEVRLDNMKYDRTPVNKYALRLRPDLWYDEPNGLLVGFHAHGSYLETTDKFSIDARIGTESGLRSIDFRTASSLDRPHRQPEWRQTVVTADYRATLKQELRWWWKPLYSRPDRTTFAVSLGASYVDENRYGDLTVRQLEYLPDPTWDGGWSYTAGADVGWFRTFRYGTLSASSSLEIGSYRSSHAWLASRSRAALSLDHGGKPWLKLGAEFLRMDDDPPLQHLEHLSRVTSIERFTDSRVFRSPGTVPGSWEDWLYLDAGRVRGYQDQPIYLTQATGGSLELTPPDLLPFRWFRPIPLVGAFLSQLDQSIFVDGSFIDLQGLDWWHGTRSGVGGETIPGISNDLFLSGGVSLSAPPIWSNHHVRLDFPLYLNKPKAGDNEWAFRVSVAWILPAD